MNIETDLMEIKNKLAKTENEIARNEGRLGGLYDDLINALDLTKNTPKKKIIKICNDKIKEIKSQIKKDEEKLQELMEEIQEEMEGWDDEPS